MTRDYENKLYGEGISVLAAMDEVGRGPLAGPVLACALILPRGIEIDGVNDSKKLSEKKRERLYDEIKSKAVIGIGCVNHEEIDAINILQATYKAMTEAVNNLDPLPQHVLIDGNPVKGLSIPHTSVVKGDSKSFLIAAASIVAKVTRDRMMREYHKMYPEYGFASNKGYGTKAHMEAIKSYGLSPIHRKSFCRNIEGL